MYRNITLGCDPELFAFKQSSGQPRSVHDLIQGTKLEPHPVDCGAVQVDGTAAEFNIDPVDCESDWIHNIGTVKLQLSNMIAQRGLELRAIPTQIFTPSTYNILPTAVKEIGCEPDYNAWEEGSQNDIPEPIPCMAVGGGHVHVGWDMQGEEEGSMMHEHLSHQLIKQLDAVLGLASFAWDSDTRRRSVYGKAGAHRLKPYGVEYRTLSNAWVKDVETQRRVYQLTQFAVSRLNRGIVYERVLGDLPRKLIDSGDADRALRVSANLLKGRFDNAIPLAG